MRADAKRGGSHTPRFGPLLRLGLESVGLHYVSVELLRKAKKGQATEREYWTLWRLLHDLVLVVLADFEVDVEEMEKINDQETVEREIMDQSLHEFQMELVRFYLYQWGFISSAFYSPEPGKRPPSQILLLAFAWLLAFSRFFEKQQQWILQRYTNSKQLPHLPPFPRDIDVEAKCVAVAALEAVASSTVLHDKTLPLDGQMHRLHSAFGRLLGHLNELESYARYHQRIVGHLELMQNKSDEQRDELIPAFVLGLIAGPASQLTEQVRLLSQSVQMIEDEAQFYKWINGLVVPMSNSRESNSSVSSIATTESSLHLALRAQIQEVQALFQAHAVTFQKIEQGYKEEWKKWTSRQQSRSRVQQLETKVERFTNEVQTRELFDPQKLFVCSQRSWEASNPGIAGHTTTVHFATINDVERLQSQVASVIGEITREYCELQLR